MRYAMLACAAAFAAGMAGPAFADSPMPMDNPVQVNGISTVCTGVGDAAQNDPRWKAYPIRVEFSNRAAQYLSGAHVVLSQNGKAISAFDCAGAWVLFQLPAGEYKVTASLLWNQGGGERSASFSPPSSGQKRVVLQFPLGEPMPKTTDAPQATMPSEKPDQQ